MGGLHGHYIVKPNLVERLGWGFDNKVSEVVNKYCCRNDYNLVKNWETEAWRKQGIAITRDSSSRMQGGNIILSKVS